MLADGSEGGEEQLAWMWSPPTYVMRLDVTFGLVRGGSVDKVHYKFLNETPKLPTKQEVPGLVSSEFDYFRYNRGT